VVLALNCLLVMRAHAQPQMRSGAGTGASRALVAPDSDATDMGPHPPAVELPAPPLDLTITSEFGAAFYNEGGAPSGVLFGGTALTRLGIVGVGLSAVANNK